MDNLSEIQNLIATLIQRNQNMMRNNYVGYDSQYSPARSRILDNQKQNCQTTKIKKTRRRQRKNASKNEEKNSEERIENENYSLSLPSTSNGQYLNSPSIVNIEKIFNIDFNFCTKNTNNSVGNYIRSRNTKAKYVRLRSFLKRINEPYIFTTDFSVFNLTDDLKKLDISSKHALKINSKKFPKIKVTNRRKKRDSTVKESDKIPFPDYISETEVKNRLANSSLIKGFVRINPKNFKDAYVSNEDTSLTDYYLTSVRDRNRSLEGDEVILELKPETEWINGYKTATVVHLIQKIHPRIVVGNLKLSEKKNAEYALLYPRDKRCPILRISEIYWPNGFKKQPNNFENILFAAKIVSWEFPSYANGVLIEILGKAGDLKVETLSILREFCLDTTPFSEELKTEHLSLSKEIPSTELEYRADLRSDCIFTIDPETARDLDDAVSVKCLPNGIYEIGVHISDASFYLHEGTELDQLVSKKATTIYMVDNVFHMLPEELCLHCSLLPGQDKLAFSVFWEMTPDGEILTKRFCRSIVNSCAKLSYEHAQKMIDNSAVNLSNDEFPEICNSYSIVDLAKTVSILQSIAVKLRQKRIDNGALKINQTKIFFTLDSSTGEPIDFKRYENMAAHRLIEELMLLANITVAEKIRDTFPDIAFLRCHEPPKQTMLVELKNCLESYGIHLDISSSGTISSSLKKYETNDYTGECRTAVLNHLVAKAMTRAKYFCASSVESDIDYKHYALSVAIYTHFTSPIRRYADIMVHRLLAASLGYSDRPEWDIDYIAAIAANCNAQKYNAKRAGEASSDLYLAHYVQTQKQFIQDCAVVDVKERSFDAVVLKTGSIVRIYQNNCEDATTWKSLVIPFSNQKSDNSDSDREGDYSKLEHGKRQLKLRVTFPKTFYYPLTTIDIELFTIVKINLERKNNSNKLEGTLLRPLQQQVFSRLQ